MKVGVIKFLDYDCGSALLYALKNVFSISAIPVGHKESTLKPFDLIFLSGGALWLNYAKENKEVTPVVEALFEYAEKNRMIIGTGEGFRLLCMMKLLPGTFSVNKSGMFISRNIYVKVDNSQSALATLVEKSRRLKLPLSTGNGRYIATENELMTMHQNKQILFRYCDEKTKVSEKINYTGSIDNIAAVCNKNENIFGILPKPELAVDGQLGNIDGRLIFDSVLATIR
jgi:phosphoribosylformylglycinamidine synthase